MPLPPSSINHYSYSSFSLLTPQAPHGRGVMAANAFRHTLRLLSNCPTEELPLSWPGSLAFQPCSRSWKPRNTRADGSRRHVHGAPVAAEGVPNDASSAH